MFSIYASHLPRSAPGGQLADQSFCAVVLVLLHHLQVPGGLVESLSDLPANPIQSLGVHHAPLTPAAPVVGLRGVVVGCGLTVAPGVAGDVMVSWLIVAPPPPAVALLPGSPAGESRANDEALGDEEGPEGGTHSYGTEEESLDQGLEEAETEDGEE